LFCYENSRFLFGPSQYQSTCVNKALVYSVCCEGCGFSFSSIVELQKAVKKFQLDQVAAENTYGKMNCWDVSSVTNMSNLFQNLFLLNEPIGCWDVSAVNSMEKMFCNATSFNQPLSDWNVSSVADMRSMFYNASLFNQSLSDWDVKKVSLMGGMFAFATRFNQPLDMWDVSGVTDMSRMFAVAKHFNQPLYGWNVGSVSDMSWMFSSATSFNQPLDEWDAVSVTNMSYMFFGSAAYSQNLCQWYNVPYYDKPIVLNMFQGSNCSDRTDPDFTTKKSFCSQCGSNQESPVTSPTLSPLALTVIGILTPAAIGAAGTFLHWWFCKRKQDLDPSIHTEQQHFSETKVNVTAPTQQQSTSTTNVNVIVSTQPTTDSATGNIPKHSDDSEDPELEIPGGKTPLLSEKK